jgi:hypothetical protein
MPPVNVTFNQPAFIPWGGFFARLLRCDPPQYPQFWGYFIKYLSALDLLLCCGKGGRAVIEKGTHLYEIP